MMMGNDKKPASMRTVLAKLAGGISPGWRWALIPAIAIAVVPVVGLATGGAGGAAVMAALADPLSVIAGRSPGARAPGALFQTKKKRIVPGERVFAKELTRPLDRVTGPGLGEVAPAGPEETAMGDAEPTPEAAFQPDAPVVAGPGPSVGYFPGGGVVVAPGSSISTGGGGGGGGGGGTGGSTETPPTSTTPPPTTTTPPPSIPAVPEPATWMTLMIGFGAVGGALRWKRRASAGAGKTATLPAQA